MAGGIPIGFQILEVVWERDPKRRGLPLFEGKWKGSGVLQRRGGFSGGDQARKIPLVEVSSLRDLGRKEGGGNTANGKSPTRFSTIGWKIAGEKDRGRCLESVTS